MSLSRVSNTPLPCHGYVIHTSRQQIIKSGIDGIEIYCQKFEFVAGNWHRKILFLNLIGYMHCSNRPNYRHLILRSRWTGHFYKFSYPSYPENFSSMYWKFCHKTDKIIVTPLYLKMLCVNFSDSASDSSEMLFSALFTSFHTKFVVINDFLRFGLAYY